MDVVVTVLVAYGMLRGYAPLIRAHLLNASRTFPRTILIRWERGIERPFPVSNRRGRG